MQKHKTWAWSLLIIVLCLDGVASWAMVWRKDVHISLFCGYPPKAGHFVSSITCREGLMALPRPGQLIDVC